MKKPYDYFLGIVVAFLCISCGFLKGNNPKPTGDMICNKSNRKIFYNCLIENIPLGAEYEELKDFLVLHDFDYLNLTPAQNKGYEFYFIWSANNLANYKIGVIGKVNSNLEIIEIEMI